MVKNVIVDSNLPFENQTPEIQREIKDDLANFNLKNWLTSVKKVLWNVQTVHPHHHIIISTSSTHGKYSSDKWKHLLHSVVYVITAQGTERDSWKEHTYSSKPP